MPDGKLLPYPEDRARSSSPIQDPRRGPARYLRLHRGLLQSNPTPFRHRIYRPDRDGAKSSLTLSTFLGEDHHVRTQIFGWLASGPFDLLNLHLRGDCTNDAGGHMVLLIEHIFERTLKTVRPEMCSGFSIDKLTRDTNAISGLAHATFEYVAHPKLAADLFHVDGPAFVRKTRVACYYKQQ